MENLELVYYKYLEELRQFKKLEVNGSSFTGYTKELGIIIDYLETNLINYEVDKDLNILFLSSANKADMTHFNNKKSV